MHILVFEDKMPDELSEEGETQLNRAGFSASANPDGSWAITRDRMGVCRTVEDVEQVSEAVKEYLRLRTQL